MVISLIRFNLFPNVGVTKPLTECEKARQNRKKRMELNRLKKNASKSVQVKNHPEPNQLIHEEPHLNIDSTIVEANKKMVCFIHHTISLLLSSFTNLIG